MELKVNSEVYNPLLKRKEISLEIDHKGQGTPQRFDVRKKAASKFGTKIENVFVNYLATATGLERATCSVQIYDDTESANSTVPEHIAVRNLSPEERAKRKEPGPTESQKAAQTPGKIATKAPNEGEIKPSDKEVAKSTT